MEIGRMANLEAEGNILGTILVDNNKILIAADILESKDFYNAKNKSIYATMLILYKAGKKIDVTTLSEALGKKLKDVTILYISELIEKVSMGSIKDYCNIVKEKSKLRSLDRVAKNILTQIKDSDKNAHEIIGDLEKYLANIELRENPKLVSDTELMNMTLNIIQKNYERGGAILGFETGIKTLDEALNGIQQKKLYVIAGRPGMAKSAFSLNIAQNISKHKHVLYYSLEMSAEELGIRRLAMKSYIDIDTLKLEKGKMSDSQWSEISNMASTISKGHCYTDCTPGTHANTMRLQCKKLKMQNKLDVLVIDYIGIMSLKDMGDSRQEKISTVCIELKNMAKEFDIPVIALAQINRGTEIRNDKRPMLSDLKESGGIEENADVVMLLYRDGYYHKDSKEKNVIEVNIAKQRGGRTGTIKLVWQPKYQLITDKTLYDEDGIYNTDIFKHKEV